MARGDYKSPIEIPLPKFEEFDANYCADKIAFEGKGKGPIRYKGKNYIQVGGYTGKYIGNMADSCLEICEVIRLEDWTGIKPLKYGAHWSAVNHGKRPREYNGMLIEISGIKYVIGEETYIKPSETGKQAELF